jgi:zinc transport system substrate-binding protein
MRINPTTLFHTLFGLGLLATLSVAVQAAEAERLRVYTVNYPLQYFAQRIAGDHAVVLFPAPDDVDPAFWQPEAEEIADFQKADLILLNGAGYAKWVSRVALPRRKLVDSSAGFRDRYIHVEDSVTHSHGPAGDHAHAGVAFTTWLDMHQAIAQSQAIAKDLTHRRPQNADTFARNLAALEADLQELDKRFVAVATEIGEQPLLASHPVYQYLARRYGLNLRSVMWEPDQVPTATQWSDLTALRAQHPARWMLWEAPPAAETAARLRALGVESMVFAPTGNRPPGGDFLSAMQKNLANLSTTK